MVLVGLCAVLVIGFSALSVGASAALGRPLHHRGDLVSSPALLDATWHAVTGFLLVIPTRNLRLYLLGPVLATEIDADHLFGSFLPTAVGRPAHDVFLLAVLVFVLVTALGRTGALLGCAGGLGHLAVDGGGFPLLNPVSVSTWSFPWSVEVGLVLVATLLFFVSVRSGRELARPGALLPVVAVIGLLAGLLLLGGPSLFQVLGS